MRKNNGQRKRFVAIGMMSGTSMDGIDVALIRSNGKSQLECGPSAFFTYEAKFRRRLEKAMDKAATIEQRDERPGKLAELEEEITERHVAALLAFLEARQLRLSDIDIVGMHGQTVLHRPQAGLTVQLGDGQRLADETGLSVVWDMRAKDMAFGGQGAPLAPVYHRALARNLPTPFDAHWPVAFVNIGGIANISWIDSDGTIMAFDTGPGNALIDQWVTAHAGIPFDQDGLIASEGQVIEPLAGQIMDSDYFRQATPKSLDRGDFALPPPDAASLEDGARTLAHVTGATIVQACEHLPTVPKLWIVCGGGRKNKAIMEELQQAATARDDGAKVIVAEQAGFDGDMIEAQAWAYLAIRSLRGLNLTWPKTTGVTEAVSGGVVARPAPSDGASSLRVSA